MKRTEKLKPAAMPMFGDAYLADTTHLTTEEHGAYFLLLLAAWRQDDCALPDDDRKLARIAGLTPRKWKSIKPTIMEFWRIADGRIYQPRQRKEHAWVCKKSEANRQAAEARWNKQAPENKQGGGMRTHSGRNAPPPPPIEEPNGSSSPPTPPRPISGKGWPSAPDWLPAEPWNGFIDMRKRKRANPTARAVAMIFTKLEQLRSEGHDPADVLDQSTLKNWTDVYPIKEDYDGNRPPARNQQDGFLRVVHSELGIGKS